MRTVSDGGSYALAFVELVENALGWYVDPKGDTPLYIARATQASIVKKAIAKRPDLYTWHNLRLAIEYCRLKKIEVESPLDVFKYVSTAVKLGASEMPQVDLMEPEIEEIIRKELSQSSSSKWAKRFYRAPTAAARREVLAEYKSEFGL